MDTCNKDGSLSDRTENIQFATEWETRYIRGCNRERKAISDCAECGRTPSNEPASDKIAAS
jgi:hypothetical protein